MNQAELKIEREVCGKSCRLWCVSAKTDLEYLTKFEVVRVMSKYIAPNSYAVMFQLYNKNERAGTLHEWFGSACCGPCAEAKAYSEYYNELS